MIRAGRPNKFERKPQGSAASRTPMVKVGLILAVVGVLAVVAGLAFIALDYLGAGDTSGLDPKDVGIVVVGVILLLAGLFLGRRR